ncbi:hypothetical protein K2X33_14485 [bacterium]|nr:hypothetical protein [bacterium]
MKTLITALALVVSTQIYAKTTVVYDFGEGRRILRGDRNQLLFQDGEQLALWDEAQIKTQPDVSGAYPNWTKQSYETGPVGIKVALRALVTWAISWSKRPSQVIALELQRPNAEKPVLVVVNSKGEFAEIPSPARKAIVGSEMDYYADTVIVKGRSLLLVTAFTSDDLATHYLLDEDLKIASAAVPHPDPLPSRVVIHEKELEIRDPQATHIAFADLAPQDKHSIPAL